MAMSNGTRQPTTGDNKAQGCKGPKAGRPPNQMPHTEDMKKMQGMMTGGRPGK